MLKPVPRWKRILQSRTPYDLCIGLVSTVGTFGAAYRFASATPPDNPTAIAFFFAGVLLLILYLARATRDHFTEREALSVHPIEGILEALRSTLILGGPEAKEPDLRICLYVEDEEGNAIQWTNYIGPTNDHGKGRQFPNSKGAVGAAFRTCKVAFDSLPQNTNFFDYMVAKYGYTRDEAKSMTDDRKSWIAVPVGEPGNVIAVIYCDSREVGFFGRKGSFRRKTLECAVYGVAEFLSRRYS